MTDPLSISNILQALYDSSTTIKTYVDAIASGNPVPYTILTKSTDNENNEKIVADIRRRKSGLVYIDPSIRSIEEDAMLDMINEILDEEFVLLDDDYEVTMSNGDGIIDKQIAKGDRLPSLKQYAEFKGFNFTARKLEE